VLIIDHQRAFFTFKKNVSIVYIYLFILNVSLYYCIQILNCNTFPIIIFIVIRSNLLPPAVTAANALLWMGRGIEGGGPIVIKKRTHRGLGKSSSSSSTLSSNLPI
jgi:hypothetical protein